MFTIRDSEFAYACLDVCARKHIYVALFCFQKEIKMSILLPLQLPKFLFPKGLEVRNGKPHIALHRITPITKQASLNIILILFHCVGKYSISLALVGITQDNLNLFLMCRKIFHQPILFGESRHKPKNLWSGNIYENAHCRRHP